MTTNNATDIAPWHFGTYHANSTQEWLPTDTKENFDQLMQDPVHREYFAQLGWDQPGAITYNINSEGFRCDEFDYETPCMIALGCSFTVGTGLPIDTIWPSLVGKATGLKVANLAWAGNSSDTCFRLAEYWIPRLKPKLVTMLAPPSNRVEVLLDENPYYLPADVIMPETNSELFKKNDMFLKHWHLNDENSRLNQLKNCLAIKQLCTEHNVSCLIELVQDHMQYSREEIGYARDHMHGGPIIHKRIAEKMLDHDRRKKYA
jgi:hypothetical protein